MKQLHERLLLTREDSRALFANFGTLSEEKQIEVLRLFREKHETTDAILGARDHMASHSRWMTSPYDVIDMVGTGGDGLSTFNISTAASLVVAGCGVPVAKHGGRGATSVSGSRNVVEALGMRLPQDQAMVIDFLKNNRYVYLCASLFNMELQRYGTLRKRLSYPTVFNILGPLLNPLQPKRYVLGVYCKDLVLTLAYVLKELDVTHALVVHSVDGLDEFSVSAPSYVAEVKNGVICDYLFEPQTVGISYAHVSEVVGGSADDNAHLIFGILSNNVRGAPQDIVVLNAAAGLYVSGKVSSLQHGVVMARQAIADGRALLLLNRLKEAV